MQGGTCKVWNRWRALEPLACVDGGEAKEANFRHFPLTVQSVNYRNKIKRMFQDALLLPVQLRRVFGNSGVRSRV